MNQILRDTISEAPQVVHGDGLLWLYIIGLLLFIFLAGPLLLIRLFPADTENEDED